MDAREHHREPDGVGVEHRASAVTGKAEAVAVDHVDVARADRVPLLHDARAFVGEGSRDARDDLGVGHRLARDAAARRRLIGEPFDQRIGNPRAAARLVRVPSGAGLLPVASHLEQRVGHLRLRPLRARLADRFQVLPDPRADVDAGDVLHPERPDRHAEVGERLVDLRDARTFLEQQVRLAHVVGQHPVGDEPETIAHDDADLAQPLGQLQRRRDRLARRVAPPHDLEQLHHVRRAEEVVAEDLRRPAARARERVDVERRAVGRQHAVGTGHAAELREHRLLQLHVLEDRLDDDVGGVESVVGRGRRDERQRALERRWRHLALGDRRLVVPANRREPALERRSVDLLQQHRDAGVGVGHRDAAAHRAGADHRRPFDLTRRRVLRDVGNLRDVAFGEKQVHERARLG